MRKILIFILPLLIICCAKKETTTTNQSPIADSTSSSSKTLEDSLRAYLKIEDSIKVIEMTGDMDGNYAIFIDYNHKSTLYNSFDYLKKFNTDSEQEKYTSWVLSKYKHTTTQDIRNRIKREFPELLGSWMNLDSYRNNLYVVCACDFPRNFIITDSIVFCRFMDGLHPYMIDSLINTSTDVTRMTLKNETGKAMNICFNLVDRGRETYIVQEDVYRDIQESHYMTKVDCARKYDLIYHVCENEVDPMKFDEVDYNKQLKKIKK